MADCYILPHCCMKVLPAWVAAIVDRIKVMFVQVHPTLLLLSWHHSKLLYCVSCKLLLCKICTAFCC